MAPPAESWTFLEDVAVTEATSQRYVMLSHMSVDGNAGKPVTNKVVSLGELLNSICHFHLRRWNGNGGLFVCHR